MEHRQVVAISAEGADRGSRAAGRALVGEGALGWGPLVRAALLGLVGVAAAWSWLAAVSRWGPASRIEILTFKAGLTSQMTRSLVKQGRGTGGHGHGAAMVSALYATPTYYAMTEQSRAAAEYRPEEFLVFYVFEDIHVGQLPPTPVEVELQLDDGRRLGPVDKKIVRNAFHHRATVVRFPKTDDQGRSVPGERDAGLTLLAHDPVLHATRTMRWELPIVYPAQTEAAGLSVGTLLALLAGLLAVLSPCLLQLTLYYTFALAGVSLSEATAGRVAHRGRILRAALGFVAGYTLVFTLSGALAGWAGERLQASGVLEQWNRPIAVAAGIGIVLLGLWMGAKAGAPGLCRMPLMAKTGASGRSLERFKMIFLGSAFAIGCSTCFGGALFLSLMIYVGSLGSASFGALALLLFSLGMAVPYLIAAAFLSRALPLLGSLRSFATVAGLLCSVVLIFFGVILISDTFHVPSDWLYRLYLGL